MSCGRRKALLGLIGLVPFVGCLNNQQTEHDGAHLSISNYTEKTRSIHVSITVKGETKFEETVSIDPANSKLYENILHENMETTVEVTVDGIGNRSTTWTTHSGAMFEVIVRKESIEFEVSMA